MEKGEKGDRICWVTYMGHRTSSEGVCLPSSEAFSIPSKRTKENKNRPIPKDTSYYLCYNFKKLIYIFIEYRLIYLREEGSSFLTDKT